MNPAPPLTPVAARPEGSSRREFGSTIAACVLAGGALLLAAGRVWVRFDVVSAPLPRVRGRGTGHDVASSVAAWALLALAGAIALPATRRWGRRLTGLVLAAGGVGAFVVSLRVLTSPEAAAAGQAARLAGRTGVRPTSVDVSAWPWLAAIAGLLCVAAGVLTVVHGGRWPSMGRRYEQTPGGRRNARIQAGPPSEADMWDSLDRGDDPTA